LAKIAGNLTLSSLTIVEISPRK